MNPSDYMTGSAKTAVNTAIRGARAQVVGATPAGTRHAVYRARCASCGTWPVDNEHASFTAGKEFSPWERDSPPKIAAKWLKWKDDPEQRVKFDNTQLGKPHKRSTGIDLNAEALAARREPYAMGEFNERAVLLGAGMTLDAAKTALEAQNIYLKSSISAADAL